MPTYERRFFLGLLSKENGRKQEEMEAMQEKQQSRGGKGSRQTRVSGQALKNKMQAGQIPNK
jgi:hypothetical protein